MTIRKILPALLALSLVAGPAAAAASAPGAPTPAPAPVVQNSFPNRDGPLSAMLAIIPDAQLAEFDKPYEQAPHITPLHSAKVGEVVALKVIFAGPKLDAEGAVDVTYDVKVIGPDGKLYGDAHEGLEAFRYKAGSPDAVFDNVRAILKLRFEPKDARGVYRFVVVLHDNNGGRHIPMTADLEFKD